MRNRGCELCQPWAYFASADFAQRRMTHGSLGVGGYGFWEPQAYPWGSIERDEISAIRINLDFCNCQIEKFHNSSFGQKAAFWRQKASLAMAFPYMGLTENQGFCYEIQHERNGKEKNPQ